MSEQPDFIFLLFLPGSTIVSNDAVEIFTYRRFTMSRLHRHLGETAPEKLEYFNTEVISLSMLWPG